MTGSEQQELEMLREFYASWRAFHKVAAINGVDKDRKQVLAQNMVDLSHAIELVRLPIVAMPSG